MTKKNPAQGTAQQIQQQQTGAGVANEAAAQNTLGQFEGPVQQSPFYKQLLTTNLQNTANNYGNLRSQARANANQAGFGYGSPNAQGNDTALQAQEAGALNQVPTTTALAATQPALQAAGASSQLGQAQTGTGLQANQQYGNMWQQSQNGLWNTIAGIGGDVVPLL